MNPLRIVTLITTVLVSLLAVWPCLADEDGGQYYSYKRVVRDSTQGLLLEANPTRTLYLTEDPEPSTCARRCLKSAVLRIRLVVRDSNGLYRLGHTEFSASTTIDVQGYNAVAATTPPNIGPVTLNVVSDETHIVQTAEMVYDVTENHMYHCDPGESPYVQLNIAITGTELSGVGIVDSSLMLVYEVEETYYIEPLKEGTTLADCGTTSNIIVNPIPVVTDNPVTFSWQADEDCEGDTLFPNYQVQILRLYNYDTANKNNEYKIKTSIDWSQALAVETYGSARQLKLTLAEGTGFYAWRVRPIGDQFTNGVGNDGNWGCWSVAPTDNTSNVVMESDSMGSITITGHSNWHDAVFFYQQFDDTLTWNFSRAFAEGYNSIPGIGEMVVFADGLNQVRLTQTFNHQDNIVIASAHILDFHGHSLLASPRAPIGTDYLGYRTGTLTNSSGKPYRDKNFDENTNWNNPDQATGSISDYYSTSSLDTQVADAEGYSFSRTLFATDPLGTERERSNVGGQLRIGGGHTQRTFLSAPSEIELISIFGDEAPDVSSVIKKVVLDENDVAGVTYGLADGTLLATCLAKQAPSSVMLDLDNTDTVNQLSIRNTISSGVLVAPGRIESSRSFVLVDTTALLVDYAIKKNLAEVECVDFCFACDYSILRTLRRIAPDTATVYQKLSVYAPESCTPEDDSLVIPQDTLENMLPGTYVMQRVLISGVLDTAVIDGQTVIKKKIEFVKDSAQKIIKTSYDTALEDIFGEGPMERFYARQYASGKLYDTLIANYVEYYKDLGEDKEVALSDCCVLKLPESPCASGCGETIEFEQFLYDKWGDTYGDELSDFFRKASDTGAVKFPVVGSIVTGRFDTLIAHMIAEGGYNCAELWTCWEGLVLQYDRMAFEDGLVPGTRRRRLGFDLLDRFLGCAGRQLCSFSTNAYGADGYLERAWKYYQLDTTNLAQKKILYSFGYDPHDTTGLWECGVVDGDSAANINHAKVYAYMNRADSTKMRARAIGLGANPGKYESPCGVGNDIDEDCLENLLRQQVDTCLTICEARSRLFKDSIIAAYHQQGYWVEGDTYNRVVGTPKNDTIMLSQISCLVEAMSSYCQDACQLSIVRDTVAVDSILVSIGTPEQLERFQEVLSSVSFTIRLADSTGECQNETFTQITKKIPINNILALVLNQKLQKYRDTMTVESRLWDYSDIWSSLVVVDYPNAYTQCPYDESKNVLVYKNGTSSFKGFTVPPDSIFEYERCVLEYTYDVPQPILYDRDHPHPLVQFLNDYLDTYWNYTIRDTVLGDLTALDTCNTSHRNATDYYESYRVPITAWDGDGDPLLWRAWKKCDGDPDSIYCDYTFPCVNGLRRMDAQTLLSIMSQTNLLWRVSPADDTLHGLGRIRLTIMGFPIMIYTETFCAGATTDTLRLMETIGTTTTQERWATTASKAELLNLIEQAFTTGIGRFAVDDQGRLVYESLIHGPNPVVTVIPLINFNCTSCSTFRDTVCVATCDSMSCGTLCFKWLPLTDTAFAVSRRPASCAQHAFDMIWNTLQDQIGDCERRIIDSVDVSYRRNCWSPDSVKDKYETQYGQEFYHYTLYYYDRAGRLVQTVPPKGVHPLRYPNISRMNHPAHDFLTQYRYNSTNQIVWQTTPDAGATHYWYNSRGLMRLKQNAQQTIDGLYSYNNYDSLGRIIETGVINSVSNPVSHVSGTLNLATTGSGKSYVVTTVYNTSATIPPPYSSRTQKFLNDRISYTSSDVDGNAATTSDRSITYYSYDPHGNVGWLVQQIPGLTTDTVAQGILVEYSYDLLNGKVNEIRLQPEKKDGHLQRYMYDHATRLMDVYTSRDSWLWDHDAHYLYYAHGPVRRMELGHDNIQGIDYSYTIQDWLKAINHPSLDSTMDPGGDGLLAGDHETFGRDVFGMILGYHAGDYQRPGASLHTGSSPSSWTYQGVSLYNGNITSWVQENRKVDGAPLGAQASSYRYDLLNRLIHDTTRERGSGTWEAATGALQSRYAYDPNGNMHTVLRNDYGSVAFDSFTYRYVDGSNRLDHIDDAVGDGVHTDDIDDQDTLNYAYDASGSLTKDAGSGIGTNAIEWTPNHRVSSITIAAPPGGGPSRKLEFLYDAAGNRIRKQYYSPSNTLVTTTWYVRDAQGNVIGNYQKLGSDPIVRTEAPIYGSSRLGISTYAVGYGTSISGIDTVFTRELDYKVYELQDHLGNVRASIGDLVVANDGTYDADIKTYAGYYPFGMLQAARTWEANDTYRYGYNGKENDSEAKGEGNQLDYGFRMHDPRVARFMSADPVETQFPSLSAYQYASNSPIWALDLDGLEGVDFTKSKVLNSAGGQRFDSKVDRFNSANNLLYVWEGNNTIIVRHNSRKIELDLSEADGALGIGLKYFGRNGIGIALEQASASILKGIDKIAEKPNTIGLGVDEYKLGFLNTFRHQLWQSTITIVAGASTAKNIGDYHELDGYNTAKGLTKDATIDIVNNIYGQEYGAKFDENKVFSSITSYTDYVNGLVKHLANTVTGYQGDKRFDKLRNGSETLFTKDSEFIKDTYNSFKILQSTRQNPMPSRRE